MASEKILNQKKEEVSKLATEMKEAKLILLTDYRGITVEGDTELRKNLRNANANARVIKNNITRRALAEAGIEGLEDKLVGPTAVILSNEDYLEPSKVIYNFTKSNDFYKDLISEIKTFVSTSKMATTHLIAISRWNSNFENEDLQYKCKSLATIYNYFKLENNAVSVTSVDNLNSFLSNEEKYSVEHFVINKSGTIKYLDDKDEYPLPENTRQYGTYIFNFIFIPRKLNGVVLGNYSLQRKLKILNEDNNLNDIDCEYSKMIISTLDGMFNGAIDVKTLNEQEAEELDKYWIVTFKREYLKFTAAVIDEIVKRFQENIK